MDNTVGRPLPGRTGQLATFEKIFDAAGSAVHVVVDGEPGSGRTALLRAAADLAVGRGFQVAWAQARDTERARPFGVARQILAPVTRAAIVGLGDTATFAALHRLYESTRKLAAASPLFLVVDDLQWCDAASLQWLGFLTRRSAGLPLVLAVARTTGIDPAGEVALDELTESFVQMRLGPLSDDDVAQIARRALGAEPAEVFSAAVHRVTGGHPGLLTAVLADVAAARLPPSAQPARRLANQVGPTVDRWVRDRLHGASPYAERLIRAVGILGERVGERAGERAGVRGERCGVLTQRAEPDLVAELAGLGVEAATEATDALVAAGLLRADDRTLRFSRPIVRTAVLNGMSDLDRLLAHARAARLLHIRGAPAVHVIEHLLATEPIGDPWAIPVLRAAARAALTSGAWGQAATRLRRALAEAQSGPDRLDLLLDLGQAELRTNVADAVAHLTEAFETAADPHTVARIAEHLATATCEREDAKAAIGVLDRAIARLAGDGRSARPAHAARTAHPAGATDAAAAADAGEAADADLVADLDILALGIGAGVTSLAYAHRIERLRSRAAERPGAARAIAGITAYRLSAAGRSRRESIALARDVLALGPPEAMRDFYAYRNAALSLTRAGELNLAWRCADVLVARGAALNQPTFAGNGHALRGGAMLQAGRLADAVDETHAALTAHSELCRDSGPQGPEVYLIEAYLELGEPAEAARLLARIGLLGGAPMPYWAMDALESRGRYRLLSDDPEGALSDFLEAGRQLVDSGVVNPAAGAWRSNAALVLHRRGDGAAAGRLVAEELALARTWGASGPIGVALRASGLIRGEAAALEESVAVLAGSPARLEYARSLYELGRFRVERRERDEARGLLREAYVIAMDCGAAPLVSRIGAALTRAGARRPRPRPSGVAALTAQERRIAELAAAGATNREIAEALFLIQRTVETHLTSVYRKLGIKGRRTLAAALAG